MPVLSAHQLAALAPQGQGCDRCLFWFSGTPVRTAGPGEEAGDVAVVVDRGSNLIAVQRDDSVGPHNTEAAQRKAFTALLTKTPTRLLAANARANRESKNLNTVGSLLLIGGGVLLFSGEEVIGAIGVGGAGGAAQDEGCTLKSIDQVLPATL